MTKQEAIEEMKKGKKITHRHFTKKEWLKSNQDGTIYMLEDGVECSSQEFWRWRISEDWSDGYFFYVDREKQTISVKIKQEEGKVILDFYSDCGKFGTEEMIDGYELTPEILLHILQDAHD